MHWQPACRRARPWPEPPSPMPFGRSGESRHEFARGSLQLLQFSPCLACRPRIAQLLVLLRAHREPQGARGRPASWIPSPTLGQRQSSTRPRRRQTRPGWDSAVLSLKNILSIPPNPVHPVRISPPGRANRAGWTRVGPRAWRGSAVPAGSPLRDGAGQLELVEVSASPRREPAPGGQGQTAPASPVWPASSPAA